MKTLAALRLPALLAWGVFAAILLLTFYPFFFMVMTSLKSLYQFYHGFWWPTLPLHIENYGEVFPVIAPFVVNSIIVTLASVSGIVFLGALSGFIFARFRFPWKKPLFYGIVGLMMIPWIVTLIPAFMVVKRLGLLDTFWVMILPYLAGGQVVAIYIFHTFFAGLPEELFEAARVDGAGYFQQFRHIGAPMSRPVIALVAIVSTLAVWNNFIWPLVTTTDERITVLTLGVMRFSTSYSFGSMNYGELFAGYVLASLPLLLLFLLASRQFMRGIMSGVLKG